MESEGGGRKGNVLLSCCLIQESWDACITQFIPHFQSLYRTFPLFCISHFFCKKYFHKNDDVIYKVRHFLVRDKKCSRNCLSHAAQYFINQAPFHLTFPILVVKKSLYKVNLFWWEFLMEILSLICLILFNAYPEVIL